MSVTQTQRDETGHVASAKCWNCQATVTGAHFCAACGKIQPLPAGTDYFAFFGLPEKLSLDAAQLESEFHKLSWKLHPDNFVRAAEFERDLSLNRSSELNDAYRTLREPIRGWTIAVAPRPQKKAPPSSKRQPNCSKKSLS